ncbi:unnamed protein product [Candidula unifasciata]|uniref:Peptide-N(4)-(N-acetyl-beta-glucosaminyl)asparagine amidase n=1 Tax=Candidula unifasciata TaxID=100452 RepID=A0A8S3YRG4_9EUPU|nr:unnamed protein product [Candidula unifasciata]
MASSSYSSVRQLVSDNSKEEFIAAADILIKFARNILENPADKKYRRIRISNQVIQNKLLSVSGGMECLFEMGFEEIEDGEFLMLPVGANLQVLKTIKEDLKQEQEKLLVKPASIPAQAQHASFAAAVRPSSHDVTQTTRPAELFARSEAEFHARLKEGMKRVLSYENPAVKRKARSIIPVESLELEAKRNMESNAGASKPLNIRDYLLLALLSWFKKSFFHWVDTLPCSLCGGVTRNTSSLPPSMEEMAWGAGRVEAHTCTTCAHVNRFPRYTNAEKLLDTRLGRCGEWADCFTLCCRALDFEARYVMDWTDHVWTEVFSESQSRWLHCDPCENICDKPLLYESGWGKKLTYVIAVSCDEIQDVTWRYSAKHNEVLARRTLCREAWLRRTIHNMWKQKLLTLTPERQQQLWHRLICELAEFVTVKTNDSENLPGRSTGSLAWRQARGELGNGAIADPVVQNNFIFSPKEDERECEMIHIVYSCAADKYIRKSSKDEEYQGWGACVYSFSYVLRKEEFDWKMVYLAREEGSASAEIVWKFDLSDTDLRISKMEFKAQSAVYENGSVSWRICAGDNCFVQTGEALQQFQSFDLHGSQSLSVTAVMQGGQGDNAWQHTQLFRQPTNDVNNYPFEIKLFLN